MQSEIFEYLASGDLSVLNVVALTVPCPQCGEESGVACTRGSRADKAPHLKRVERAIPDFPRIRQEARRAHKRQWEEDLLAVKKQAAEDNPGMGVVDAQYKASWRAERAANRINTGKSPEWPSNEYEAFVSYADPWWRVAVRKRSRQQVEEL